MFEKEIKHYEQVRGQKRTEGTDEYLISFFFRSAIERMESELAQKHSNTHLGLFLF